MYECVKRGVPFVLAGSIRDDGPLPDVITDVIAAQDTMRAHLGGIRVALMLATTLHAIATGNMLPAGVETYCVDINQAVVTKLADRGSHQALGIVTDVGLFLRDLVEHLAPWLTPRTRRRPQPAAVGPALPGVPARATSASSTRSTRGCTRRSGSTPTGPAPSGRTWWPTWSRPGAVTEAMMPVAGPARPGLHRQRRPGRRRTASWSAASGTPSAARRPSTTPNGSPARASRSARSRPRSGSASRGRATPCPSASRLVAGYRFRSDFVAHAALARLLGIPVRVAGADRRPLLPPRPDVLSPGRPSRHHRPARLGPLRPGRHASASCPSPSCSTSRSR